MTAHESAKPWSLLGVILAAVLLGRCAPPEPVTTDGVPATVGLVSPTSPLGLNYGESATLTLGYKLRGEPRPGITLRLSPDGDDGGATLSTAKVVTNDQGEASALLTAGAAESAFHVLVSAPQAEELVIDVAVSRYAFGTMRVELDATTVAPTAVEIEAGLFIDQGCAELMPMAKLTGALRSLQKAVPAGGLLFSTLLLRDYTVIGRAADKHGRLVARGCVGMPERLLKSGIEVPLTVPLQPVSMSPVGSFTLTSSLQLQLPSTLYAGLACKYGLAQTLIDALVAAVPAANKDVALRLQTARAALDPKGCRSTGVTGEPPDQGVQTLLGSAAGMTLGAVAVDLTAVQSAAGLRTQLDVRGSADTRWVGDHTLQGLTLQTPTKNATYPLSDVPVPLVRELPLRLDDNRLVVPSHALSLQLPRWWRRALTELILVPRGVTQTPMQLWQMAIGAARSGTAVGCDAVEAVLCSKLAAPCKGVLVGPCQAASTSVAAALLHALDDANTQLDLRYGLAADLDDPDDAFQAKALANGLGSGEIDLGSGTSALTATVIGTRRAE